MYVWRPTWIKTLVNDICGYFILFCVYIWLFKCVYIVLCIYLAFQISYIYVRRIDSSLFFYAGFFGAPWKIRDGTMAAPATMGVSIHTLGLPWASIAFQHAHAGFSGSVFGWPLNTKLFFSCFSKFERDSSYPIWLRCAKLPVELFEDQFLLHGWF